MNVRRLLLGVAIVISILGAISLAHMVILQQRQAVAAQAIYWDWHPHMSLIARPGLTRHSRFNGVIDYVTAVDFSDQSVYPEQLVHLADLPYLDSLDFSGSSIADGQLEYLWSVKSIGFIDIRYTSISGGAAQQLRSHLPEAQILTGPR